MTTKVLDVVNDFILRFLPYVSQNRIYQGYSNKNPLPSRQFFCVISISSAQRVGTNVETYTESTMMTTRLMRYAVTVDFIGMNNDDARTAASVIEMLGSSRLAIDWFRPTNVNLLYSEGLQYLPYVYEDKQYCHRYRTTLHLDVWEGYTAPQETAAVVEVNADSQIENIDVHHKIKEGD